MKREESERKENEGRSFERRTTPADKNIMSTENNQGYPKCLAVAFSLAVTDETKVGCGRIAAKGPRSLYHALETILPQVIWY